MIDSRTKPSEPLAAQNGWPEAIEYCNRLGPVCTALPAIIRSLFADEQGNQGQLSAITKYQVGRICCGSNFKSMLYHFTRVAAPEYLNDKASVTVGELIDLYLPSDLSALMATFSLARMIRKRVPSELYKRIAPHLAREAHIGALTGVAVPNLGFSRGILCGTLPHISHALMSIQEPTTYTSWRESLTNLSMQERRRREYEAWGCSAAQVASMLLVRLGFPGQLAYSLALASEHSGGIGAIQDTETRLARMALLWFECLLTGQEAPHEVLPGNFFPFKDVRASIDKAIKELTSSNQSWIEKTSDDISAEKTPRLFTKISGKDRELEVPGQLKEVFTVESLTKMDEWQFDALVNHIDKEIAEGNISTDGTSAAAAEIDSAIS